MPQHDDPRHNLRLPADLKSKLAHAAIDNGRSVNAEILARLERSFAPDPLREIESLMRSIAILDGADRERAVNALADFAALLGGRPVDNS